MDSPNTMIENDIKYSVVTFLSMSWAVLKFIYLIIILKAVITICLKLNPNQHKL